jgi:secreted PhoX family phosphatase
MPDLDDAAVSRRLLLKGAAAVGAAGIAVTALATGTSAAAGQDKTAGRPADDGTFGEPFVVHVRDVAAGEIDIYRGTAQTSLVDRDLAARLARASR